MNRFLFKKIIGGFLVAILLAGFSFSLAQTDGNSISASEKIELQRQLDQIQAEISQYEQQLSQIRGEKKTLQNKLNELKKQQAKLTLQIQATTLQITQIDNQLDQTEADIQTNLEKVEDLKVKIKDVVRLLYQRDDYSLLYLLLAKDNLSDILTEFEIYIKVSTGLHDFAEKLRQTNEELAIYKQNLSDQQEEANNLLAIQNLQRGKLLGALTQQDSLLAETKGIEANYQSVLNDTKAKAAQIRNRLYEMLGISKEITFGQAVEIANWAFAQTGVRSAFLLAVLTQESNLGKNVGTCNRPGDPPSKSYKVIMKPDRDIEPFLKITAQLGMDPEITPVSCPMRDKNGNRIGWGGAMGPAQFIPSTWMGYKDKVAELTGKPANPWDIRDAFLAAAIKLKAGGAGSQDGEWAAAMRYFSGSTNTKYRFYGDNVVKLAAEYQEDIDNLK